MKLNDLPFPLVPLAAPDTDARAARDCAERVGRRLWRGDQREQWMRCVPELALAAVGAAQLPALVCEEAAGLIRNTLLALSREPAEARSDMDDVEALVRAVSRLDPPLKNGRRLNSCDCDGGADSGSSSACRFHALASALAIGAVRGMLSATAGRA